MATVCTGNGFAIDPNTGELEIDVCGDPAEVAPCAGFVAADNALRVSDCGLYVNRAYSIENRIAATAPGRVQMPNRLLGPGQQFEASTAATDWQFTNPSRCCPATVTAYVSHFVTVRAEPDTRFTIGSVTSRSAAQQNAVAFSGFGGDDAGDGTLTLTYKINDAVTFPLTPGEAGTPLFTSVLVRNTTPAGAPGAANEVRFVSVTHDGFAVVTSGTC